MPVKTNNKNEIITKFYSFLLNLKKFIFLKTFYLWKVAKVQKIGDSSTIEIHLLQSTFNNC